MFHVTFVGMFMIKVMVFLFFTVKMEAALSSETLVSCHIIIQCHKLEDES